MSALLSPWSRRNARRGAVIGALAIAAWWLFFSRAPWMERLGALALMVVALVVTARFLHVSIAGGVSTAPERGARIGVADAELAGMLQESMASIGVELVMHQRVVEVAAKEAGHVAPVLDGARPQVRGRLAPLAALARDALEVLRAAGPAVEADDPAQRGRGVHDSRSQVTGVPASWTPPLGMT